MPTFDNPGIEKWQDLFESATSQFFVAYTAAQKFPFRQPMEIYQR